MIQSKAGQWENVMKPITERSLILKTKKQIRSLTVQEEAVEVRKTPSSQ